jgi:hypothetical protein
MNELCGLGITHISGVALFASPATFRFRRSSTGAVHVTTSTGLSLTGQWLREEPRCVEALGMDHHWVDITTRCQNGSIPQQVVQEWSDRNQRTLVDFRISP